VRHLTAAASAPSTRAAQPDEDEWGGHSLPAPTHCLSTLLTGQGADDVERVQDVVQRVQVSLSDGLHQDNDGVVLGRRLSAQDNDDAAHDYTFEVSATMLTIPITGVATSPLNVC